MILARCPACATTFRVRPEQLQARGGRVRCGHCQHPFNALEAQVAEDPTAIESGPLSVAPPGVPALYPAFDVTPAALVDAIVTEAGVSTAPHAEGLARLLALP